MHDVDDMALLRGYIERGSEECFATLVARHVNKVYSVALRHTGSPHAAEEITQAVFVILARKARHLGRRVVLSGWLYHTARLTALASKRSAIRRAHREQEAYMQTAANQEPSAVWPEIVPLLDVAMSDLNQTDRNAVVLRYFDGRSLKEVAAVLGSSEEAAKKRVQRALERLRIFFTRRGISLTTMIIAGAISAYSVEAAPAAVVKSVSAVALSKGTAASASTSILIKASLKLIAWTKLKFAALVSAGILLASGSAIVAVNTIRPGMLRAEKIWEMYSQVFARDLSGPERANEREVAFAQVMKSHPPIALIRRSPVQRPGRSVIGRLTGIRLPEGSASMGAFMVQVLRYAYALDPEFPQNRIIIPAEMASTRFDFVDTMPQGGREALRRALKEQFGLVARREMRKNMVLTVKNPDAGLHKHSEAGSDGAGGFRSQNVSMEEVAKRLSKLLGVAVSDQTHLAGGYDFTLNLQPDASADEMKAAILDQLGLQLIPADDGRQIEFLIADQVK